MDYNVLWTQLQQVMNGLWEHYLPLMIEATSELGVKRRTMGLLLAAVIHEPEPISQPLLQKRNPYQSFNRQLCDAEMDGFFFEASPGKYHLTTSGGHVAEKMIHAAYDAMKALNLMPSPDLHIYVKKLKAIVQGSLNAPEPPGKWCITHSHRLDPGENAPLVIRLDQYLSDLYAYHDDAYLAAWQPLGFDGPTWETLTIIHQEKASTYEDILKQLAFRDQPSSVYQNALDALVEEGLISQRKEKLHVTPKGRELLQKTEEQTETYFFAPWQSLTPADVETLENLSKILIRSLSPQRTP